MIADWFSKPTKKIGFEDVKVAISSSSKYLIINTLLSNEQDCLIKNTVDVKDEERTLNSILDNYEMKKVSIIVYGKNAADNSVEKKYKQLVGLGFSNVYMYSGGLFEWMLLQDIYGDKEFPTTKKELDILKYKPIKVMSVHLLEY